MCLRYSDARKLISVKLGGISFFDQSDEKEENPKKRNFLETNTKPMSETGLSLIITRVEHIMPKQDCLLALNALSCIHM